MGRFVGLRLPEEKPKKDTKKPSDTETEGKKPEK